ncbi:MAG TPA: hypothetical protein VGN32_02910 [Ktedonobacterales bacterium]|nr:hypothetical protein [Ktedonobacterales bacterium]
MRNTALVLWLEGLDPEQIASMPALREVAHRGVDLRLVPMPLAEPTVCYYQTLTGMGAGKIGRFDSVYPERYVARDTIGLPQGIQGRLLPDVLGIRGLAATFEELTDPDAYTTLPEQTTDCAIVRVRAGTDTDSATLDALVRRCGELAPPATHLLILTDVWRPAPTKLVNINDFLADIGLLEVGSRRSAEAIVWPETLAYGLGTGQVWVNLRGREPHGGVRSSQEYQEVRDALVEQFTTQWLDPDTNEPVVEQVIKKEAAYTGDFLFSAPDLIVVFRPQYGASPRAIGLEFDGVSVRTNDAYAGTSVGAPSARLIAAGPVFASGLTATASLIDFAPSVMYLLGQPIPQNVDGRVITSMFSESYCQQHPVAYDDTDPGALSQEEESLIVDRLRTLGYLG